MRSVGPTLLRSSKPALASLLVGLLMCLGLLAASAEWHRAAHHSDDDDASPCLVCLLSKGQFDSQTNVGAPVRPAPVEFCSVPTAVALLLPDRDQLLLPSRAPPFLAASFPVAG